MFTFEAEIKPKVNRYFGFMLCSFLTFMKVQKHFYRQQKSKTNLDNLHGNAKIF